MGQQLPCREGQVVGGAGAQPEGDVSGSVRWAGPGSSAGCSGAHLQEPQERRRTKGVLLRDKRSLRQG